MHRIVLEALCVVLTLSGPIWAQITIPTENEPYKPIVASVEAQIPDGAQVRGGWHASEGVAHLPAREPKATHLWAPPGSHWVSYSGVWVLTRDVVVGDETLPILVDFGVVDYRAEFRVVPPNPDPDPDPGPDPTPGPIEALQVAIVSETSNRSAQEAATIYAIQSWAMQQRLPYVVADPDQVDASGQRPRWLQSYLDACSRQDVELPALLAVTSLGDGSNPAHCRTLPSSAAEAIEFLTQYLPERN